MKSKVYFTLLFLLLRLLNLSACSGIPKGFCYVHAQKPSDVVLKGTLIASGTQSVQLQVLEVLSGVETRSIVTVWDGKDFNCTAQFSMKASLMANVGDTILIILPMITSTVNTWDVVGDYRRPYYLFLEPILFVRTDTVYGLINGNASYYPPYWSVQKMSYQAFKNYWTTHQNDCVTLVGLSDISQEKLQNVTVSSSHLEVQCSAGENYHVQLYTVDGSCVLDKKARGPENFYFDSPAIATYFVVIDFESGERFSRKYILSD